MSNNKIFMRTPRGWMQNLAKSLGVEHTIEKKIMFDNGVGFKKKLISKLISFYKSTRLPPLEWFISYKYLFKGSVSSDFIIETGSKMILTSKPYIVYVESGIGLFSFNTNKINKLNLVILKYKMTRPNFLGFVFYSDTARKSTKNLLGAYGLDYLFSELDLGVIYPFSNISNVVEKKSEKIVIDKFNLLFCSSSFELKGGREVLESCKNLSFRYPIHLKVVTKLATLPNNITSDYDFCEFIEFDLSDDEYRALISNSHLIIHPTYFDTHALSLLEGIALGTPFIATATFAIQEYKNREPNGILINNPFLPYDSKALPNFKGKALDYAKNVSEHEKVNECMILEICNSMSKIFDNYSFFKI